MKLKANRKKIQFEYEFIDGATAQFEYLEPTTKMIDKASNIDIGDIKRQQEVIRESLNESIKVVKDDDEIDYKEKLFEELEEHSNIYEFKASLDESLGKLRKRK